MRARMSALRRAPGESRGPPAAVQDKRKDDGPSTELTTASDTNQTLLSEALDLICPFAILASRHSDIPSEAMDNLRLYQTYIASGSFGRVAVLPMPKQYLNSIFTSGSGRQSRYNDEWELVALKSRSTVRSWHHSLVSWSSQKSSSEVESIPFKDVLPELIYLSAPALLYHENIVDLLGYFWEPHGDSTTVTYAPTLILEFTDHGSLRDLYDTNIELPFDTKKDLCIDICRALQTLHHELSLCGESFGLYHGDLKPE